MLGRQGYAHAIRRMCHHSYSLSGQRNPIHDTSASLRNDDILSASFYTNSYFQAIQTHVIWSGFLYGLQIDILSFKEKNRYHLEAI